MIKILDSENGEFFFNIVAANGEVLATSETYTTKDKAIRSAKAVISIPHDIGDFTIRKKKTSQDGSGTGGGHGPT